MNGLAGCYVSTIGKPHEYFDLTGRVLAQDGVGVGELVRSKKVYTSRVHRSLLVSECYCRIHARGAACGEIGC